MNAESLTSLLAELPVPQVRAFDSIGSTNDEAKSWAADGAADGCLVIADQQTQGRGRFDRRWITLPGASLAFSLILRPTPAETAHAGLFSPLGALAISQALEQAYRLDARVKWPNDVLLHDAAIQHPQAADWRKTAGILVEAVWTGAQLQALIIGIGINVAPSAVPPANELLFPAMCVEDAAGQPVKREQLLKNVLASVFAWRPKLLDERLRIEWDKRLAFKEEWVQVEETGGPAIIGQVVGLDSFGSLLLRTQAGEMVKAAVGDVHLRLTK